MVAPTFSAVSLSAQLSLNDLTVTGGEAPYWDDDDEEWYGGVTAGKFVLYVLNNDGSVAGQYLWEDYKKGTDTAPVQVGPGWFLEGSSTPISEADAKEIRFNQGQAFWIRGFGLQLVTAGAVTEEDITFATRSAGNTAVGNATPVDLTLGKLTVSGGSEPYWDEDDEEWYGGITGGKFVVYVLNSDGSVANQYLWEDYKKGTDTAPVQVGPGWFLEGSSTPLTTDELNAISIPAGLGLWIRGAGASLNIPAPEM